MLLCLFVCMMPLLLPAQQGADTLSQNEGQTDMLRLQKLLYQSEGLRLRDSIRAVLLQEEVQQLKNEGLAGHHELQEELNRIRIQDSLRLQQQKEAILDLRQQTKGSPVLLFHDTLFVVYAPLGPFSAEHRAKDAAEKIHTLYKNTFFHPDSLSVISQHGLLSVHYHDQIITSISATDALWVDKPTDSLAKEYAEAIGEKIVAYQRSNSLQNTAVRVGYAALVIAVLWVVLWLFNLLFKRIRLWVLRHRKQVKGVRVRNYQLFTPQYIIDGIGYLLRTVKLVLTVIALYLALSVLFSIFPYTHNWANILLGWAWNPVREAAAAIFHYLPNLFTIFVILFITRLVAKAIRFLSGEVDQGVLHIRGFHKEWAKPTFNIVRFFLYAFAFVLIFPYLPGSDSLAFKGVSVFLGILFSIGSSSAVANTVAGIVITYMRPFQPGDWIKVNDITGYVVEKNALVTRVRTILNEDVTIPNAAILSGHTVNYSSSGKRLGLVIAAKVTVTYENAWETIHPLLIKAAMQTKDINKMQTPFVFQSALNDFYVTYQLNIYTNKPERMYHIQSELYQQILSVFKEAGIQLMSPQPIHIVDSHKEH